MCEKHRILRILYHIPSKCGIPIFKFFQKTVQSRSSKRNTQYARPCKRRERAKQNMASRGKGAASSRGTAMRRPRSGRQVSTSESPPKRQRRYGLLSSSGLSGSQCSRSSPKGRSSPRRMGPNGSVNRLENRRRICRQPFSGSRTPIRRFPVCPPPPRAPQPLPPPAGDGKGRIQCLRGDGQFPRRLLFLKNRILVHKPPPPGKKIACASVYAQADINMNAMYGRLRR